MNIPTMPRPLFNKYMLDNYETFKIFPTNEAYESYSKFVERKNLLREANDIIARVEAALAPPKPEKIAEITTAVATPGFKVSIEPGYMISDIETTEVFKVAA